MKNSKLPILNVSTAPSARSQSNMHLDALFQAICLFLNLNTVNIYTPDLIGILSAMHNKMIANLRHDAEDCIKHYKLASQWFVAYLRGRQLPFDEKQWNPYHWDESRDLPSLFVDLLPFLDKSLADVTVGSKGYRRFTQAVYCFLSGHRVIVTPMKPNYTTITAAGKTTGIPSYSPQIPGALEALGITPAEFMKVYKAECSSAELAIVTSAGPNGQATWSAHEDACAVKDAIGLMDCMTKFANDSNLHFILGAMIGCAEAPKALSQTGTGPYFTGRIHPIEEWGGKTRLVAILDYWTQSLLTPLHNTINVFLRRLTSDGTADQGAVIEQVKTWTAERSTKVYAYDLTAATDRLPITFQRDILSFLFGSSELANAWMNIMSDRDFSIGDGQTVRYSVGQPMGAKSSFAMLALAHHVIVQMAALGAGVTSYTKYVIVGDDNVQTDKVVADAYVGIMTNLGVEINLSKSLVHESGMKSAAEICKRIFIEGVELTVLPPKLIVKASKFGYMAATLQNVLFERGKPLTDDKVIQFVGGIVDRKSLLGLIILNKVPTSVSGLAYNVKVSASLDYQNWHPGLMIDDNIITQAFSFALISEQLKRVDGLLRGTIQMNEVVKAAAETSGELEWPPGLFLGLPKEELQLKRDRLPPLTWDHPMAHAAHSELNRVASYISGLQAGSPDMVAAARRGLLDLLRNSLHEVWLSDTEKSSTVYRSVFNSMLSSLDKMAMLQKSKKDLVLNYSVLLSFVGRMWSVVWAHGQTVQINVVKSRVESTVAHIDKKIKSLTDDLSFKNLRI